jgi:broad specificity phosphatase PhoE
MEELLLARHGESTASVGGLANGDASAGVRLPPAGREQARGLGRALAAERIDLCVTTRFVRTVETADIALRHAGRERVPRLVVPELDDITLGDFEGEPIEDFRAWLREHGPSAPVPGGGESRAQVIARYARGFELLQERPDGAILAVIHGLPIAYALAGARGEPLPLSLAGNHVAYATAYRLTGAELAAAVRHLRAFAANPVTA